MRRALGLWLLFFAVFAAGAGLPATPGRDLSEPEAQSLLVAVSVVSDGDLDLRDQYAQQAWRPFYEGRLEPRGVQSPAGGVLDPVGIAFPMLVAPAYAFGGRIAVELFLAALAAVGFVLAAALARRLVPEPWATGAVVVSALSPPAVVAATTVAPDAIAGTALAGAALLALRLRERPALRWAMGCAVLVGLLPWLGAKFVPSTAVAAIAATRWLRRRRRGLAGLVAIEIVIFSVVLYITVNDRLYGGPFPAAALADGATGAHGIWEHLARAPRLIGLWVDRDVGILRWAPFAAMAFAAVWLLVRSRRERLAMALSGQVDVEVSAGFLAALCAASAAFAAFLAPTIDGPWFAGHELASVLPAGGALAAWGLRRFPRAGRALAALTLVATMWVLLAPRLDPQTALAPPRGPLPWLGAQDALPRLR